MNKNDLSRWGRSLIIFLLILIGFSIYLYLRRGYYNIYIINKVLGSTAVLLSGITLFIGPLSHKFPSFAKLMSIRRNLGLLAFGIAILHVVVSLVQTERFVWFSWYFNEWIPVTFGVLAIGIWVYMTFISRDRKIVLMGSDVWKKRLSFAGNLAFLAIFLHLTVMKYEGWIRWLNGQVKQTPELANPSYPPASLFVFLFMVVVIVYRIANSLLRKPLTPVAPTALEQNI